MKKFEGLTINEYWDLRFKADQFDEIKLFMETDWSNKEKIKAINDVLSCQQQKQISTLSEKE